MNAAYRDTVEEARILRRELAVLATRSVGDFLVRYDLLSKKSPSTFWGRVDSVARRLLAKIGILPSHIKQYKWLPALKHGVFVSGAKTLLIWAVGAERDSLRDACLGFQQLLADRQDLVPVLVTDVADFVYFSRLGWLVEYLPELVGEGQSYQERKRNYLAWRYRDAIIVPAAAGLLDEEHWNRLLHR